MSGKNSHEEAVVKRVSRKHDDEGHGGAWKVAFADFCLALMCLFLVLWVLAVRDNQKLEEVLRGGGDKINAVGSDSMIEKVGYPRGSLIPREPTPGEGGTRAMDAHSAEDGASNHKPLLSKRRYDKPEDLNELAQVLAQLSRDAGLQGNLQMVITPYGLRVMLHDTDRQGMFERGSALPNPRFRKLLGEIGPLFAQIDNQLLIVGHTDALQYRGQGSAAYSNWALSSNRAMAARSALLDGGMPGRSILQVVGMADRAPLEQADPEAAQNRRIELLILTTGQAGQMAAMFGAPSGAERLRDNVSASLPDAASLARLREQLKRP